MANRKKIFRLGELFCGPGGLAAGALKAKAIINNVEYSIKHAWANDYDPDSCETYRRNLCNGNGNSVICEDVSKLDIENLPNIDCFAYGFPCNDFSIVGEKRGFDGKYGPLYSYGVKILDHFKPKFFVAENVKGMSSANDGRAFSKILSDLARAGNGYELTTHLYKFEEYGVPQTRHRIIIVGIDKKLKKHFAVPAPTTANRHVTIKDILDCVFIDQDGYSEMCVDALKILGTTAATDFGGSRQRDMAQLWADMTRGYLGEMAVKLFLKEKYAIDSELGHELGSLTDYLPTDIHSVKKDNEEWRSPRIRTGIKTAKWNGIWFDIPGDQFNHSDVHILVKTGAGREHLLAFFKKISVFKDKVLKIGESIGSLTKEESLELFDKLPTFKPIPAYMCGHVRSNADYSKLSYTGKKGRIHYTIKSWNGPREIDDLEVIAKREDLSSNGKVKFESIGQFNHQTGYLFNTGNMLWKKEDWDKLCQDI